MATKKRAAFLRVHLSHTHSLLQSHVGGGHHLASRGQLIFTRAVYFVHTFWAEPNTRWVRWNKSGHPDKETTTRLVEPTSLRQLPPRGSAVRGGRFSPRPECSVLQLHPGPRPSGARGARGQRHGPPGGQRSRQEPPSRRADGSEEPCCICCLLFISFRSECPRLTRLPRSLPTRTRIPFPRGPERLVRACRARLRSAGRAAPVWLRRCHFERSLLPRGCSASSLPCRQPGADRGALARSCRRLRGRPRVAWAKRALVLLRAVAVLRRRSRRLYARRPPWEPLAQRPAAVSSSFRCCRRRRLFLLLLFLSPPPFPHSPAPGRWARLWGPGWGWAAAERAARSPCPLRRGWGGSAAWWLYLDMAPLRAASSAASSAPPAPAGCG